MRANMKFIGHLFLRQLLSAKAGRQHFMKLEPFVSGLRFRVWGTLSPDLYEHWAKAFEAWSLSAMG